MIKNKGWKIFAICLIAVFSVAIITIGGVFATLYFGGEPLDRTKLQASGVNLSVLYRDGSQMDAYENKKALQPDEIPRTLSDAFVSVEDKRFYRHSGLDYRRIAGAFVHNLRGGRTQGGSTISQQLIKNTHLSSEQTFQRKWQEAQLALKLERSYSKDEIMCMYLNALYFGSGQYGVKNAAMRYFGKNVDELTAAQCAMLAAIVKSPTKYNPVVNPENAFARKDLVLKLMHEQKRISDEEYRAACSEKIEIVQAPSVQDRFEDFYLRQAMYELSRILQIDADELPYLPYTVTVYCEKSAQINLSRVLSDRRYYNPNDAGALPNGIGICVDNRTGGVVACAGLGTDRIDLTAFRRQPASVIKPLVSYAPAIETLGFLPDSPIEDTERDFDGYRPTNYKNNYLGWSTLKQCLAHSQNVPAVELLRNVGVDRSAAYLKRMGFALDQRDYHDALALGGMTHGTTITELAGGYMTLANGGVYTRPTFVAQIRDGNGKIVYRSDSVSERVFSDATAYLTTDMLLECAHAGTASKLNELPFSIAAKTGTNSASDARYNKDAYLCAYTSRHTMVFWQGNSDANAPMSGQVTGGGATALMCKNFADELYRNAPPEDFTIPDAIVSTSIDEYAYTRERKIVLADPFAPSRTTRTILADASKLNAYERDASFSLPKINGALWEKQSDGTIKLTLTGNPRLRYRVSSRVLGNTSVICELEPFDQLREILLKAPSRVFSTEYFVTPYYVNDKREEILGLIDSYRISGMFF